MGFDVDDEILQDFLVEAGEILEQLGEQLVDLEQQPDDYDLLNAVFRGFHTIKGGAGFLGITQLVDVCHRAEDVFNVLRQGERSVDAQLMDVVLQVLDVVNEMFEAVREGETPDAADPSLLTLLEGLATPGETVAETTQTAEADASTQAEGQSPSQEESAPADDEITEEEFDALLDELHGKDGVPTGPSVEAQKPADDEITEEEFEALLDELHGKGAPIAGPAEAKQTADDEITEEEFECLLDELHGKGKHVGKPVTGGGEAAAAEQASPQGLPDAQDAAPKKEIKRPAKKTKTAGTAKKSAETSVRVDTQRLDDIMNMVGELVLVRNRLATLKATVDDEDVATAVSNLDLVTSDLQLAVMKTRMQPIKKVFGRFPRVVRDLARSLNKEIELEMHGEDTDLDKNLVEALADPMVHLVRNAVDHGIESPEERVAAGKPRKGKVVLSASQEGDHIILAIEDDGKGMDPDVLRRKAVEKGMMDEEAAARLDDKECYNLIFQPGFSTKTEISDVSGRGVGMDVVKTRIAQMNGTVEIDSEKGRGSRLTIKLPLTLAILPTLMVMLGEQSFALPLANVVEIFNLDLDHTNTVDGQETILVRNHALPLFYLSRWLVRNPSVDYRTAGGHVVVVNIGNTQIALVVDCLIGQEEVVIKPLGAMLHGLEGMAGATITGDGKIALILDIPGLMRKYAHRS